MWLSIVILADWYCLPGVSETDGILTHPSMRESPARIPDSYRAPEIPQQRVPGMEAIKDT